MLARVLEPEVMDSEAEADAYDAMDHAEVNRRFVDDLLRARAATANGPSSETSHGDAADNELLDIGCGTGRKQWGVRVL